MDAIASYHMISDAAAQAIGSRAGAHLNAGLAVYVAAQFVLRDRRASVHALSLVVVLEAMDLAMGRLYSGVWHLGEVWVSIAATMFWPATIYALGRYRRHRWTKAESAKLRALELRRRSSQPFFPIGHGRSQAMVGQVAAG